MFTGEVGVIVLGVMISLGLSELMSELNDRAEAREMVGSMRSELAEDMKRYRINGAELECIDRSLGALLAKTEQGPLTPSFPPLAHVASFWTMHTSAWEMARVSPSLTKLPLPTRNAYAHQYAVLAFKQQDFVRTDAEIKEVRVLIQAGDAAVRRSDMRLAALRAKSDVRDLLSDMPDVIENSKKLGIDQPDNADSLMQSSYYTDAPCPFPPARRR